jgi:hypothetical protein
MEGSMAGLFQVLRGKTDGTFEKAKALDGTNGEPLIIPVQGKPGEGEDWINNICTRPFAVDWNGDGHLDLVVGNFPGTFYLFKGRGKGAFLPVPEELKAGDQPLKSPGHHSDPFVVDWDGDGDLDLLTGSSEGGVHWAENRAGPGKAPELGEFRALIQPGPPVEYGQILRDADLKGPLSCTRVWADDVNGDGKLDLLVGDLVTLLAPAANVSEDDFRKRLADWNKELSTVANSLNSAETGVKKRTETQERYQRLYQQRTEFMTEDRTGFVWLYLRK